MDGGAHKHKVIRAASQRRDSGVSAPTPLPAPGAVIAQIDADAQALDTASKSLYRAIKNKAEAEQEYEKELRTQLITIFNDAKANGERMPAEDLRKALAHKQIPHKVYADYIVAVAEVEAMTARTRAITAAMNGRQSLLAALRDELRAAA